MRERESTGAIPDRAAEKLDDLRRRVSDLIGDIRASRIGPAPTPTPEGARPVVIWLPDTRDPEYRARLASQCERLAKLTVDEEGMAAAFEQEAAQTHGWR